MSIPAWRIANQRHAAEAFSGEGAKLYGGRWNPPGLPAVYTAESLALAILEMIVHLDGDEDIQNYLAVPVRFEEGQVIEWPAATLPRNWARLPVAEQTQRLGQRWLREMQSLVLKVPSSVVPQESNYIINPLHPAFESVKIGEPQPLRLDPRISRKLR